MEWLVSLVQYVQNVQLEHTMQRSGLQCATSVQTQNTHRKRAHYTVSIVIQAHTSPIHCWLVLPILQFAYHVRWASIALQFRHLSASAVQIQNILLRQALLFALRVMQELTLPTPLLSAVPVLQFA